MEAPCRQDTGLDDIDQRLEGDCHCAHPIDHCRDVDLDAPAGEGTALAMQRQMQAKAISASNTGSARPRAIGCEGAGGWVIASLRLRQA